MRELFHEKFSFSADYFSALLDLVKEGKRKFPQALIFEGSDTQTQYLFALELARILNCQKDGAPDCDCINCKWIKTHSHPAIQNVSQIHFKGEKDETKTVISASQAKQIESALLLSSDYHRFFIFFSSKEKQYDPFELSNFQKLGYDSNIDFDINPLTYSTFHQTTPNALLKSIEEPPEKTTFVFLTKSKEDILPTIVSRCQTFKLSGQREFKTDQSVVSLISSYPNITLDNCLDVSDSILAYIKANDTTLADILDIFLEYLLSLIKSNLNNDALLAKINNDIELINDAIKQLKASMQDKVVVECLLLRLARGY